MFASSSREAFRQICRHFQTSISTNCEFIVMFKQTGIGLRYKKKHEKQKSKMHFVAIQDYHTVCAEFSHSVSEIFLTGNPPQLSFMNK